MTDEYQLMTKIAFRWIELVVLIGLVLLYGWATFQRNLIWKHDISLWLDTVEKSPAKARPHNNLAVAYNEKKLTEHAIAEAITALKLRQNYPNPFISIGDAYFEEGFFDTAINAYKNALIINSDYPDPYIGMGNAYAKKGEMNLAIDAFKKAVELCPNDVTVRINLAAAYGSKGLTEQAIKELQQALSIKPDSPDIHYNLGVAYELLAKGYELRAMSYEQKDLINKAINEYKKTLMLNPYDLQAKERIMKLRAKGA
jgi:tetratricopeptide (TPR) repeat protein